METIHNRPASIEDRLFINGEFCKSTEPHSFISVIAPFDGTEIAKVHQAGKAEVDLAVAAAKAAFPEWNALGSAKRKPYLMRLAQLLLEAKDELALLESLNLGRTLADTVNEVLFQVNALEYYAIAAADVGGDATRMPEEGMLGVEVKQPFGVVGCLLPWNVPVTQFLWKAGAAVAVGNTVVLKSSEKAPLSSLKLAELVQKAGFPKGVINVLSGDGPTCGAHLVAHPDVARISFTGSTATGLKIQQNVAASGIFKTLSFETGGKCPCLVFADTDLQTAARKAAFGMLWLGGQTCVSNSRILVDEKVADEFIKHFQTAFTAYSKPGEEKLLTHPTDGSSAGLIPLVDKKQFEKVLAYIEEGKKDVERSGGKSKLLAGGYRINAKGYFIAPTIFCNLPGDSRLIKEEIFGPVVCINTFKTEAEAIRIANDSLYGLHAAVFTNDVSRAVRVSKELQTGMVTVNSAAPDVVLGMKFGGWKNSGLGDRDGWMSALQSMVQPKTISIRFTLDTPSEGASMNPFL